MNSRFKSFGVAVCTGSLLWLSGCSGEQPAPQPTSSPVAQSTATTPEPARTTPVAAEPVDLGAFADEAIKTKAAEMAAAHDNSGFPADFRKDKENAPAFLYLAATAEDEAVRHDALRQIASVYTTSDKSDSQMRVDENYDKVVLHYLGSDDQTELYYALKATKNSFRKESDPTIIKEVVRVGNNHPEAAGRQAAMASFAYLGSRGDHDDVIDLYVKAYSDEPIVASEALYWTRGSFSRSEKSEEVKQALIKTLASEEPGVRGRGIEALAQEFPKEADLVIEQATPLLKDESPFVRAKALDALSRLRDARVYNLAAPLLDDSAETKHRLKFTNIMGQSESINHSTFGWGRVDGTALKTIEKVSRYVEDKDAKFSLGKVDYKTKDDDIAREVEAVKKWLAARK